MLKLAKAKNIKKKKKKTRKTKMKLLVLPIDALPCFCSTITSKQHKSVQLDTNKPVPVIVCESK